MITEIKDNLPEVVSAIVAMEQKDVSRFSLRKSHRRGFGESPNFQAVMGLLVVESPGTVNCFTEDLAI
jgi:hypothetical protein